MDLVKRTSKDLSKVLKSAIDIYSHKVIGLAGLPDSLVERQTFMRGQLNDLIKSNVLQCI